eukprot:COSAG05_NODE_4572_length_1455_cov_1.953574_2_plen_114_part_00
MKPATVTVHPKVHVGGQQPYSTPRLNSNVLKGGFKAEGDSSSVSQPAVPAVLNGGTPSHFTLVTLDLVSIYPVLVQALRKLAALYYYMFVLTRLAAPVARVCGWLSSPASAGF